MKITFLKDDNIILSKDIINSSPSKDIKEFSLLDVNTKLDLKNKIFTRDNNEYIFSLDINNKKSNIYLKKENLKFDIVVDFCSLDIQDNTIYLEYMIESEDSKIALKIEGK